MTPDRLAALHELAFDDTPRPWTAAEFASLLAQASTLLVSGSDGFVLGRVAGPEAEILTLAVHPDARRRGVATGLIGDLERLAAKGGAEECLLEVAATNEPARALYHRLGYRTVGRRPGYYRRASGPPVDAIVLGKALAASAGNL